MRMMASTGAWICLSLSALSLLPSIGATVEIRNSGGDSWPDGLTLHDPPLFTEEDKQMSLPFVHVAQLVLVPLGFLAVVCGFLWLGAYYHLAHPSGNSGRGSNLESGAAKRPCTEFSFLTPNVVRLALTIVVFARFMWFCFVYSGQRRLYAEMVVVPNNSIAHYVTQRQWDFYRPISNRMSPYRLIGSYTLELVVIWLAAPLVRLRSRIWCGLKKCSGNIPLAEEELTLDVKPEKSAWRSALRYAFWFSVVSVLFYIRNDVINKLLLVSDTHSIPITEKNVPIAPIIIAFANAARFDPNSVYLQPGLINAETGGLLLTPVIYIGTELAEKILRVDETLALIAHELGHWRHRHTLLSYAHAEMMVLITFVGAYLLRNFTPLYAAFGYAPGRVKPWVLTRCLIVGVFVLSPLWALYTPYANTVFWAQENEADAYAQRLGYAKPLCSSLVQLHSNMLVMDPLFAATMSDHPPLVERLEALGC